LRGAGVHVCFLSGDERVNMAMAKNRNIDFYSARGKDKADFVEMFEKKYQAGKHEMLYIGDDLFDLSIMKKVGHAFCPQDAPNKLKNFCGYSNVIPANGGENLVAKMVDLLLDRGQVKDATMEDIVALDKKETF
jgi:3-deoxy-D-manno-octulosonate 8-phosphate phosphatase (KDO 8-P phosphatase)